jgi:hypothetical protein
MSKTHPAQLDREITESLTQALSDKRPLYGHTSESTAYLVDDYPYGFRERTQIRYWLEEKPKKGWRFVSQTKNPKTGRWNKPKASTYADWGAAMYLDDKGHVQWTGVGAYSDERQVLTFVRAFPEAKSMLRKVIPAKLRHLRDMISGKIFFTINGERQEQSARDIERLHQELAAWEEIGALLERG